jgi:uncharacterized protein YrrD
MIKSRDLIGRLIVTITTGEIVGKVKDVLIDPQQWTIAALVLPSRMFSRETIILPRSVVHVFGKDVVLVKSNETMARDDSLDQVASLLAVSGEMRGRSLATEQGLRLGVLDDLLVDEMGKVVAYELARVFVHGPLAESKQIPFSATRSVGPDLIIIESSAIEIE